VIAVAKAGLMAADCLNVRVRNFTFETIGVNSGGWEGRYPQIFGWGGVTGLHEIPLYSFIQTISIAPEFHAEAPKAAVSEGLA